MQMSRRVRGALTACLMLSLIVMGSYVVFSESVALWYVKGRRTAEGPAIASVLEARYGQLLAQGRARWTTDDYSDFNVYFEILDDVELEGCPSGWVWRRNYRWRMRGWRVLANTSDSLELTPQFAPLLWAKPVSDGCYPAPATEQEVDQLQALLEKNGWMTECPKAYCSPPW
jgi:hypothetical protein